MSLSARFLSKRFGPSPGYEAVQGANLELADGDFISILGRSGSGKSTLLALLGALTRPTAGTLLLDGTDVWSLSEDDLAGFRCRTIGFVFQFPSLLANLTALDNVAVPALLGGSMSGEAAYAQAGVLIERVGLADRADAYPGSLSGGEQRRVAIARALINSPRLVLADEPTSDLDEDTESDIIGLLEDLRRAESFGLVLVTHNLDLARRADRTYKMQEGRLFAADVRAPAPAGGTLRSQPIEQEDVGPRASNTVNLIDPNDSEQEDTCKVARPRPALPGPALDRAARAAGRSPDAPARDTSFTLGANLWRNVKTFMLAGTVVIAVILLVDLAVSTYQQKQVRDRGARLAQLADMALARLQSELRSVIDLGDGRYELSVTLRNTDTTTPIYVPSPDMHAFVQVGRIWQEIPLNPIGDGANGVVEVTTERVYRYEFEARVKDFTQLLPNYMHVRFSNAMLVSPSRQPKGDIFERKDNFYIYLKPFDIADDVVLKQMKFSGKPPVWIPMPPH